MPKQHKCLQMFFNTEKSFELNLLITSKYKIFSIINVSFHDPQLLLRPVDIPSETRLTEELHHVKLLVLLYAVRPLAFLEITSRASSLRRFNALR